jgi:hypothetical protein
MDFFLAYVLVFLADVLANVVQMFKLASKDNPFFGPVDASRRLVANLCLLGMAAFLMMAFLMMLYLSPAA